MVVPRERIVVVEASPDDGLRRHYVSNAVVRFVVHPDTWTMPGIPYLDDLRSLPRGEPIRVAPTASTRTVLVLERNGGVPPHFLKLHLPRRISRFVRRLRRKAIVNSVAVTRDLHTVGDDAFGYLADALGCVLGDDEDAWGFLVREELPRPHREGRILVPAFALYAGDAGDSGHRPLIVQLIEHHAVDPTEFLLEAVLLPVVRTWARVVRTRGLLLEMHAQNTLLELDRALRPTRIVYRDGDIWIDGAARRRLGLSLDFRDAVLGMDPARPPAPHYSLVYDHFLGRELFDYLVAAVARFFPVDERAVHHRVRAALADALGEHADVFPRRTTFYFADEVRPDNQVPLVDTHSPPRWR